MSRSRRSVVCGAIGVVGLLAGCVGNTGQPGNDSTIATDSTPSSGSDTATSGRTETADRTDRTASPTATETRTSTTDAETVPTDRTMSVEVTVQKGALTITDVSANFAGNEQHRLGSETVTFENTSNQPLDVSGYTVEYAPTDKSYTFPESWGETAGRLPPGETFKLYSNSGALTIMPGQYGDTAVFEEPALSSDGGTVIVTDDNGSRVLEVTYSPA